MTIEGHRSMKAIFVGLFFFMVSAALAQGPQGSGFVYQGELRAGGVPVSGTADLQFRLYDASTGGVQIGSTLQALGTQMLGGRFSASLDFGSAFAGQQRWLEIDVRSPAGAGAYTTLSPRHLLSSSPYSTYALNSGLLGGQLPNFYRDAGNLNGGTIPDARLATTVARTNTTQTFTGATTFNNVGNVFAGSFTGTGSGLISLDATSISLGTLADARLSSNVPRLNAANTWTAAQNSFTGNIDASGGVIRRGGTGPLTGTNDLGLYSQVAGNLVRFVTNGGFFNWYVDSGIGTTPVMTLSSNGLLSLGGGSPERRLNIRSSGVGNDWISLQNSAGNTLWHLNNQLGGINLAQTGVADGVIFLSGQGNVGVNEVFPQQRLDVNGGIRSQTGGFVFPDQSVQKSAAGPMGTREFTAPLEDFVVPNGVYRIRVEAWGSGGGGGLRVGGVCGGSGGSGAYVRDVISVVPGESIRFEVGVGGDPSTAGGHTRVVRLSNAVVLLRAGGGGGANGPIAGLGGTVDAGSGIRIAGYEGQPGTTLDSGDYVYSPFQGRLKYGFEGSSGWGQNTQVQALWGEDGYMIIEW